MKEEMKKCVECNNELVNRQRKYCSMKCKGKYKYHNNTDYRLKKIERSKKRVYEQRELDRVEKEKDTIRQMLGELSKEKTAEELEIEMLFNLINNKK